MKKIYENRTATSLSDEEDYSAFPAESIHRAFDRTPTIPELKAAIKDDSFASAFWSSIEVDCKEAQWGTFDKVGNVEASDREIERAAKVARAHAYTQSIKIKAEGPCNALLKSPADVDQARMSEQVMGAYVSAYEYSTGFSVSEGKILSQHEKLERFANLKSVGSIDKDLPKVIAEDVRGFRQDGWSDILEGIAVDEKTMKHDAAAHPATRARENAMRLRQARREKQFQRSLARTGNKQAVR